MATLTLNPHTSDTSLRGSSTTSFAAARALSTGSNLGATATTAYVQTDNKTDGTTWIVDRYLAAFDTSAIGGGTINSATLSIVVNNGPFFGYNPFIELVANTSTTPTSFATSDYSKCGATRYAAQLNPTGNGTWTFTLNSTGLAAINKTGYTVLSILEGDDFSGSLSSPMNIVAGSYGACLFYTGDSASNKPVLTIDYTPALGALVARRPGDRSRRPWTLRNDPLTFRNQLRN